MSAGTAQPPEQVRYALIIWTTLRVLAASDESIYIPHVIGAVWEQMQPTPYELEKTKSGSARWEVALHFQTGDAATVGWMTKRNGWSITDEGLQDSREVP